MKAVAFIVILSIGSFFLDGQNLTKLGIDTSDVPTGIPIGERAPSFKAQNTLGEMVDLSRITKEKVVVLIFYRGDWCPVCNKYLAQLSDSLNLIAQAGAEVIFVTPNTVENAQKTKQQYEKLRHIIVDSDGSIMKDYRVNFKVNEQYQKKINRYLKTDIASANNQSEAALPVPATYIIGQNGLIIWRHFDLNYQKRAGAGAILRHLP